MCYVNILRSEKRHWLDTHNRAKTRYLLADAVAVVCACVHVREHVRGSFRSSCSHCKSTVQRSACIGQKKETTLLVLVQDTMSVPTKIITYIILRSKISNSKKNLFSFDPWETLISNSKDYFFKVDS